MIAKYARRKFACAARDAMQMIVETSSAAILISRSWTTRASSTIIASVWVKLIAGEKQAKTGFVD